MAFFGLRIAGRDKWMTTSDFDFPAFLAEQDKARLEDAFFAHTENGTLKQRDWSKICKNAVAHNYTSVHGENTVQYLIEASLDTRHVAILCAPEAHLDPYEIGLILDKAAVDGSTILAAYLHALSEILAQHYSKACKIQNFHPFIKDGKTDWMLYVDSDFETYMSLLAQLWDSGEQEIIFDAGAEQILYAALEADLEAHDIKPDWFIPSTCFLPFEGRQPVTDLIVCDLEVYKVADIAWTWHIKAPDRPQTSDREPKGVGARIKRMFKR